MRAALLRVVASIVVPLSVFASASVCASNEAWYQQIWCEGQRGRAEVELPSGHRVDCLTQTHAIEMDFARKWPEAIGQSLHYAMLTGKRPGIVLIINTVRELRHFASARSVIEHYHLPVTLWTLGPLQPRRPPSNSQ